MSLFSRVLNFVLPPRCIVTGEEVDFQGMLSPTAWRELHFISDPLCVRCGFPFEFDTLTKGVEGGQDGNVCAPCLKAPPVFGRARSALVYDDASRNIVLSYKHADQTASVPSFVPWMNRIGGPLIEEADFLMPVPLHRWRLMRRRFNQSGLIATALAKNHHKPCLLDGLQRVRSTPTQGYLKADERRKNVKNAFAVNPKHLDKIRGKKILLIDDVYTTGSTVSECVKSLLKAGAVEVNILTLARVVKPQRG